MKNKILFFIPQMVGGGAEKVTVNIMKLLDKTLYDLHLVTLDEGPAMAHVPDHVTVHLLHAKKTLYSLFQLRQKIRELQPHIVFSSLLRGHIALTLALIGIRNKPTVILRSPNSPKLLIENAQLSPTMKYLTELAYTRADKIIAQTPEMKAEITHYHHIDPTKINVLINPIDSADIDKKITNQPNPFDPKHINVIAAGRLLYQKGFDVLIDSFTKVIERNPLFRLYIIGEDVSGMKASLEQQVTILKLDPYITFLGYQPNPYPYFKHADVYALSSRWEGLPNTVLESLYLQTPVIATRCIPYLSELIQDGDNGYLVEVEDAQGLADAILQIKEIKHLFTSSTNSQEILSSLFNQGDKTL